MVLMLTSNTQRSVTEYFSPGELETIKSYVMNPVVSIRKQKIKSIDDRVKQLARRR